MLAEHDNERLRHIRLHERVNDLPDPNYSTLKYFMGHLHKVVQHEAQNAMSIQNLAIVFGPTLFGQSMATPAGSNGQMNGVPSIADASYQNKVSLSSCRCFPIHSILILQSLQAIETILEHYTDIFVDENEAAA